MSKLFVSIVHLLSFKPQSYYLTTMSKATIKKLGPQNQRVYGGNQKLLEAQFPDQSRWNTNPAPWGPFWKSPQLYSMLLPWTLILNLTPIWSHLPAKWMFKTMLFYILYKTFQSFPQSQNDYLREWLSRRSVYLHQILSLKVQPENRLCSQCLNSCGNWRCLECMETPIYCMDCCWQLHAILLFHRI